MNKNQVRSHRPIGLLWYDDNPTRTFAQRIAPAVARYIDKFGNVPNVCYVHPVQLPRQSRLGVIEIKAMKTVQRNYFFIVREE